MIQEGRIVIVSTQHRTLRMPLPLENIIQGDLGTLIFDIVLKNSSLHFAHTVNYLTFGEGIYCICFKCQYHLKYNFHHESFCIFATNTKPSKLVR